MSLSATPEGETPCQKLYIELSQAYAKYFQVFQNSSHMLKEELKKYLVFECCILNDNGQKLDVKSTDKWEMYAMYCFAKKIGSNDIEERVIEKLWIDPERNILCEVEASKFKQLFAEVLGKEEYKMIFTTIGFNEFFSKYFQSLLSRDDK